MERPGSSVLELRLRLYRPDPPDGAVEAYLAALAEVLPPEPVAPPRPDRPRRHALGAAAVTLALIAVAAAGLGMARQAASAATAAPSVPTVASHLALPAVPGLPIGDLYGGPATTGLFDAHGVRAVVSVYCSGDGTIRMTIGPEPAVVLTCEVGGPALAMFESAEDLDRFTVDVAPQPGVRWSLQVGAMALPAH